MKINRQIQLATMLIERLDTTPTKVFTMAEEFKDSPAFLQQICNKMQRKGLIESVRGPGGGFRKPTDAKDCSLLSIYDCFNQQSKSKKDPKPETKIDAAFLEFLKNHRVNYKINVVPIHQMNEPALMPRAA